MQTKCEVARRRELLCVKYDLIKEYVTRWGLPADQREDLIQEIFVAAYSNVHKVRDMDKFDGWLFKIAYNKMLRVKEKNASQQKHEICYLEEYDYRCQEPEGQGTIWTIMGEVVSDEELHQMIWHLPTPAPYILRMRYEMGFNLKEIAICLDMKYNTVKTIERRSLIKLRTMISEQNQRRIL